MDTSILIWLNLYMFLEKILSRKVKTLPKRHSVILVLCSLRKSNTSKIHTAERNKFSVPYRVFFKVICLLLPWWLFLLMVSFTSNEDSFFFF